MLKLIVANLQSSFLNAINNLQTKMDQGRTWVGQANQRVIDQLKNDPYSLSYNSGIRRMRDNSTNPIIKALAGIAYVNPLLSGTDMEAGAMKRNQAQQEESILKSLLPSDQFQSYKDEKMHQQAYDLISKVAFNAGTVNPVGGSMKGAITNALQKGTIGADEADDYMRMLQENALKGRSPVGNPEIFTRTPQMKTIKNPDLIRKAGIAQVDDLVVEPRTDGLSRARIDEYKQLIEKGAEVPGVVLNDKLVNGKATIFDGNHRATAYQELGMPVPVSEMTVNEYRKFLETNPNFTIDTAKQSLNLKPYLRQGQNGIRTDGGSVESVARERFDIGNLKKLSGGGSDRDVFDLGDGNVLKVAKNARGLSQNILEGEPYAPVPKLMESGKNYVVVEKVNPPDKLTKQIVNDLKEAMSRQRHDLINPKTMRVETMTQNAINEVASKYIDSGDPKLEEIGNSLIDLLNYDVMAGDLTAIRNWGTKDGMPVLLDAGTLQKNILSKFATKKAQGLTNLDNPEFRQIYNQSKQAKKIFGDVDKNTMYGIGGLLGIGALVRPNQKIKA